MHLAIGAKEAHFYNCSRNIGRRFGEENRPVTTGWYSGKVTPQIIFCPPNFVVPSKICF